MSDYSTVNKTIVSTSGKVLQEGTGGLVIAGVTGETNVLWVDEVSDEDTINFFCYMFDGNVVTEDCSEEVNFEILANHTKQNK